MSVAAVIDGQWGDTGKGKIVDYLVRVLPAHLVSRYGGGDNSGHRVTIGKEVYDHHVLPSGIAYPFVLNVIGNGVVVNPKTLCGEIDELRSRGVRVDGPSESGYGNLLISEKAHIIMPWHIALDKELEEARGDRRIGTTQRGIGPVYMSKAGRAEAIRVFDIVQRGRFEKRVGEIASLERGQLENKLKKTIPEMFEDPKYKDLLDSAKERLDSFESQIEIEGKGVYDYCERLKPYVGDCTAAIREYLERGDNIIFEGAQGTLLDVDHGTYPNVTSSNATKGGIFTGTGFGGNIGRTILVSKAYTTRVGEGTFPTELKDKTAETIREVGREYGTTTGRPRRAGWGDTVILGYSVGINNPDEIALTKLDVLGGLKEVKLCVAYEIDGTETTDFPVDDGAENVALRRAKPIYETFEGWPKMTSRELTESAKEGRFPTPIQKYLDRICDEVHVPITIVSVGPERDETVVLQEI